MAAEYPSKFETKSRPWLRSILFALGMTLVTWTIGVSAARIFADLRKPLFPVAGRVLIEGHAALQAEVTLYRRTWSGEWEAVSWQTTDFSGRFTARIYNLGLGLPNGEYKATVRWRPRMIDGESLVAGPNLLAGRFARPESSPLVIKVPAQETNLAWNLPLSDAERPL